MTYKIALVTGGFSREAEVSYKSAKNVARQLDPQRFDVYMVDIRQEGWYYIDEAGTKLAEMDKRDFSIPLKEKTIRFDAVFICLHGTPGEDGKLQGYLDLLGLPYTSCNTATSAITFNKRYTVAVAAFSGIKVANSIHLIKGMSWNAQDISGRLRFPVFVKPNNGGSSIGMSKVDEADNLETAIHKAFQEDDQVLIEEMIQGREFTVGVYRRNGKIVVLPITEVKAHAGQSFFDFEAKYQGKSDEITPAVLEDAHLQKLRQAATRIYEVFNCGGVVRIDFIFHQTEQEPYMLEINTVPGQSDASIIPQQVRAAGLSMTDFYGALLTEILPAK